MTRLRLRYPDQRASTSSGSYSYDSTGNMTEKSDVCATAGCMTYGGSGAGPHALTAITGTYNGVTNPTFTYDDNGNMLTGPNRTASYTSYNMTAKTTEGASAGAEFVYGPEHQRTKMCVPNCTSPTATTWYLYDPATGGISEKVVSGSTTTWRDYIVVPGAGLVAVRIKSGSSVTWLYEVPDHLGSAAAVVNVMGMTPSIERDSYDSWGRRRNADGTDNATCSVTSQIPRGYTTQEEMDTLCLANMNARLYDPTLGRFMSADTMVPDPMSSQSYNKYSYVENSPTNAIDPTGHVETVVVYGDLPQGLIMCVNGCGGTDLGSGQSNQGLNSNSGDVETVVVIGQRIKTNLIPGALSPVSYSPAAMPDDEREAERERDAAICNSLSSNGARGRCWESAAERDADRAAGRPVRPLITTYDAVPGSSFSFGDGLAVGGTILLIGGIAVLVVVQPEIGIPAAALAF
jgi:RHS repeat-associated protein